MKKVYEGAYKFFRFDPGEKARVMRGRYAVSHTTPLWMHCYEVTIVRYNKSNSVTVIADGYENEKHYVDQKDLVPLDYDTSHLA